MVITYTEYMKANPDATIIGGKDLDHDMEFDDRDGWEKCIRCGGQENEVDDVCPMSDHADFDACEWEDYEEVSPGVARYCAERNAIE